MVVTKMAFYERIFLMEAPGDSASGDSVHELGRIHHCNPNSVSPQIILGLTVGPNANLSAWAA